MSLFKQSPTVSAPQHEQAETGEDVFACAWCLREAGITPDPRASHGICDTHAKQMLQAHAQLKANKQHRSRKG